MACSRWKRMSMARSHWRRRSRNPSKSQYGSFAPTSKGQHIYSRALTHLSTQTSKTDPTGPKHPFDILGLIGWVRRCGIPYLRSVDRYLGLAQWGWKVESVHNHRALGFYSGSTGRCRGVSYRLPLTTISPGVLSGWGCLWWVVSACRQL